MLYEREGGGKVACEGHATFVPMAEEREADWRRTIERELGHDADPCEFCVEELTDAARHIEATW